MNKVNLELLQEFVPEAIDKNSPNGFDIKYNKI